MPARDADRGGATILAAFGVSALLVLVVVGLQLAGAVIARHRAESAADLAAVAGAAAVLRGPEAACEQARMLAWANGAVLDSCRLLGLDVRVVVTMPVRLGVFGDSATGRARAGPVSGAVG